MIQVFLDVEHLDGVGRPGNAGHEAVYQGDHVPLRNHARRHRRVDQHGDQLGHVPLSGEDALGIEAPCHAHTALHGCVMGEHDDVVLRPKTRHLVGGSAGARDYDRFGIERLGQLGGSPSDGLGLVTLRELGVVVVHLFGLDDGCIGDAHRLHRIRAHGDFVGQQNGVATVKHGVGDVGHLGSSWRGGIDH